MPAPEKGGRVESVIEGQNKINKILDNLGDEVVLHVGRRLVGMLPRPKTNDLLEGRKQIVARETALGGLARPALLPEVKRLAQAVIEGGKDAKTVIDMIESCINMEGNVDYKSIEFKAKNKREMK